MQTGEFLELLRESLDMDVGTPLNMSTNLDALPEWDSLTKISFMATASVKYGINISAAKVRSCATVADLFKCMEST